jgi:atlastin
MSQTNGKIEKIESVQIIRIEETEFVFDYNAVKSIIEANPECANLPVAIVIINGALRTGKSFFNNFVIRHLMRMSNDKDKDKQEHMLYDYFRSRRGPDIQTLGIWALNKIFVYKGKAIILMDTQGIFDRQLNQAMTTALICLSTLMSSYQIYNIDKRIQEDHLNNMAYFSAYTDLMDSLNNTEIDDSNSKSKSSPNPIKAGQTLSLLVRDWQNFEDNFDLNNCIKETEKYQKEFLSDYVGDPVKKNTRDKIMNTFDNVNVRLCPHPGHMVTEGVFFGNLHDVRKEFLLHIDYIIGDILNNIEVKRISSNIDLVCSDVPNFMKRYVELYRDIKENLPEPRTILETTSKISQIGAKTNTVSKYKHIMIQCIKNKSYPLDKNEMIILHSRAKDEAYKYFNSMCVMGEETEIRMIMNAIELEIGSEYENFTLMSVEKNFTYRINQIISLLYQYIKAIVSMDWNSIGLSVLIPSLFVLRYMMMFFLPSGLINIADYFIGTVIWIMVGMLIVQYTQYAQYTQCTQKNINNPAHNLIDIERDEIKKNKKLKRKIRI